MYVKRYIQHGLAVLLLALSLLTAAAQNAASPPVQVFFGPRAAADETSIFYNLMRFLDSCKTSIHGSIHELDMVAVAQKLSDRAADGVDVSLVLEQRWWDGQKNLAARQVLERSRVKVMLDTKKSGLMHNKFFVGDGVRTWTGSTNLTETCLFFNPNNAVWIEDARVARNFEVEFQEEHKGGFGLAGSGKPNTPEPLVTLKNGTVVRTLFSPEDKPVPFLVDEIDRARTQIDVMCFVFSSEEIGEALLRAHERGVKVRVLLDNLFGSANATGHWKYVPANRLSTAGVIVRYDNETSKLHHKVVILDDTVITGSFNLSANAATNNDENIVILRDAVITAQYREEFDHLWNWYNGLGAVAARNALDEEDMSDVD